MNSRDDTLAVYLVASQGFVKMPWIVYFAYAFRCLIVTDKHPGEIRITFVTKVSWIDRYPVVTRTHAHWFTPNSHRPWPMKLHYDATDLLISEIAQVLQYIQTNHPNFLLRMNYILRVFKILVKSIKTALHLDRGNLTTTAHTRKRVIRKEIKASKQKTACFDRWKILGSKITQNIYTFYW